ncbi:MAG: LamG domain-containing protein, partial [Roseiflexaceae bacterium]
TAANSASGASSTTNLTLTSTTWVAATLAPAVGTYNEQAVPVAVNPLVGVFDSEQSVVTATVRISGGLTTGDILSMTPITSTMGSIQVASYSAGTLTLVAPSGATPYQWSTALRAITFSNTISDNPGTSRTLAFRVRSALSTGSEQSMTFSVVPVNDAPVAANTVLTSIAEDVVTTSNTGDSVASLVGAHTDRDTGASKAMAITAIDARNGQWQFSSNSGSSWTTMTGISASTALLLLGSTSSYRIRFVPDPNYVGDATLTFRAWDESSGSPGTRADTTSNGGSTPFSSDTATATIGVLSSTDPIQFSVAYTHKAVQFNGSNAYLSNAHTSLNALRDMTLAFWMKPDLLSGTQSLIGQNDVLEVSLTSTGATTTLDIWSAASNTTDSIDVSTALSVGSWAHVVIVGDAGRGTLDAYINGVLTGSTTFTASDTFGSSSNTLRVGGFVGDNGVANYYHGQIDEISIWKSTFDATTIAGLRYYRPISTTPNLVAYWACDEGTSNSIANTVSGAPVGSNLTLNGATAW